MTEYDRVDDTEVVAAWERTHKTDEWTRVAVVDVSGTYLVLAVDVDRFGREVIDEKLVATTLTADEAEKRAENWMEENPKGVAGDGPLASLFGG